MTKYASSGKMVEGDMLEYTLVQAQLELKMTFSHKTLAGFSPSATFSRNMNPCTFSAGWLSVYEVIVVMLIL